MTTQPTARDPRKDPKPGDRLKLWNGDEYTVLSFDGKTVIDTCDKGTDCGEILDNELSRWQSFWGPGAEVLHAES